MMLETSNLTALLASEGILGEPLLLLISAGIGQYAGNRRAYILFPPSTDYRD